MTRISKSRINLISKSNRRPRCELPEEKLAITEQSRTKEQVYLNLDDARSIIGALKQPYRTLCESALYAGMRVGEMCLLNDLWPRIRKQLSDNTDPVRVDISGRKGNRKGYFTFIPARLLKPFTEPNTTPFKNTRGKVITGADIEQAFKFARKRAGITKKVYPHMIRDLFRTASQYKAGMDGVTANYLMGHSLKNEMGYLQPEEEPEKVLEEWKKWQSFLDTGVASEQEKKVADMKREIELLQEAVKLLQEKKK